ncbi:MAG: 5-formyltetrahydrofolate cyclo-ligase [Oscillospiraceae bacterium]|nr:5-formyltetrahydrofolate cyclo-ligase [Oscillospiraceae bacterium]MBQ7130089.1 5-formyltetrahydrofolate cyclo-ligase [Oscillospiraceae bacterium]
MLPTKQDLRSRIRRQKQAMSPEDVKIRSDALCRLVLNTEAYRRAKTIYGYLPFNQEVQLQPLLQQALRDSKQIALPKCYGREMRFILTEDLSRIQHRPIGAPEPIDDGPIARDPHGLVIVPGLIFDPRGYRIGYGGGYYDRFLSSEPEHPTIALCFDFQVLPRLEPEPHDIPVDTVLWI